MTIPRIACSIALLLGAPVPLFAQSSVVYDALSMESEILGGPRKYAVYLPPGYDTSERSYPVLYLLHGAGDDQTGWVQFGEVQHIADKALAAGKATPMIIIMPDANTGRRGYGNSPDGSWRYEDFFFEEFMPYVESTWRIKGQKRYRAVAGLSMGGGGSFTYALHRPDLFSSSAPLSAYVGPSSVEDLQRWDENLDDVSEETVQAYIERYNAVAFVEALDEEGIERVRSVRWYIDCGDDDFLFEGNARMHIELRKREIPHEYRVRDGGHTWTYWRDSLPDVLYFVSQAFHQH